MTKLTGVVALSQVEQNLLESWSSPPTFNRRTNRENPPPGLGKFLIKVGGRPGIPLRVELTGMEKLTSNTNKRWADTSRIGTRAEEVLEPVTGLDLHADDTTARRGRDGSQQPAARPRRAGR